MKKSQQRKLRVLGIGLMIIVTLFVFYFAVMQTVFSTADKSLIQRGVVKPICITTDDGFIYGPESIIKTPTYEYKFKITKTTMYIENEGTSTYREYTYVPSTGELESYGSRGGTGYAIEVYRNGVLIDSINPPTSLMVGPIRPSINNQIYRSYGDNGQIYKGSEWVTDLVNTSLPEGVSGINVIFGYEQGGDGCSRTRGERKLYVYNKYELVLSPIDLSLKVINFTNSSIEYNLISKSSAKLELDIQTIGDTTETKTEIRDILSGNNYGQIAISSEKQLVRVAYKQLFAKSNLQNLNIVDKDIIMGDYLVLSEGQTNIVDISEPPKPKPNYWLYGIIGVGVCLILFLVYRLIKRKN